jgi:hypothetical protein
MLTCPLVGFLLELIMEKLLEKLKSFRASLIPVYAGKKATMEWEDLQTREQPLEEVKSYNWQNATGIAIISGVNGYMCFDIDKAQDDFALKTILTALGLPADYQWQVRSGSGKGYHLWIKMLGEIPFSDAKGVIKGNSIDGSFDHLELRLKECYTVIPPSKHPSGGTYQ